ncbi:ABC transporter ATP-binding protein [Roseibium aggregatum]|uniref:ABC transporter ATP-binding protein n=1 Tax=Roseibium aggregatum TaxID=187304 RepID=A0A926P1U9_9HYPH|nr:ABC transporter ATP-binding protein [Roseibium aggregatum]MBD1544922.1 ABC transporter ATP-binding protein [Roseibium aggregatum]
MRVVLERLFGMREALWLAPLVLPYRWPLAALFGLSLVAAGTALIPPWLTKLVIDRGLMAHDKQALITFALALFVVGLAALALGAVNSLLHLRFSARLLADLRRAAVARILAQSPRWQARQKIGELMSRLDGDAGEVQQFTFAALVNGGGSLLRLIGGLVMLFVLAPKLAVLALVLAPVELVFFAKARPVTHEKARGVRKARGELASGLAETITGLGALRALNATKAASEKIEFRQQGLISALLSAQVWNEVTRAVPMVLTAVLRGAVFLVGGLAVIDGTMLLGSLIAFTAYLGFLIGPMQSLISLWHGQARMKAALDRLDEIMSAAPDVRDPADPLPLADGDGDLVLSGISYSPAGQMPLFEDVSLTIPAGTKLRLSGPSGIGKSSLLSLLQRHDDPHAGAILLNGTDLRRLRLANIRSAVALIPQKGHVFSGTLADNLRLGSPEVSEEEMLDVLRLVELDERFGIHGKAAPHTPLSPLEGEMSPRVTEGGEPHVRTTAASPPLSAAPTSPLQGGRREQGAPVPHSSSHEEPGAGLETPLGEGGLNLSGGERQRLCLARALLQPFRVLILDESLSEVDAGRVSRIMAAIDTRFADRTRIVVTHGDANRYGTFDEEVDLAAFERPKP